jgi:hypothetical protein
MPEIDSGRFQKLIWEYGRIYWNRIVSRETLLVASCQLLVRCSELLLEDLKGLITAIL